MDVPKKSKRLIIWNGGRISYDIKLHELVGTLMKTQIDVPIRRAGLRPNIATL